MTATVKSCSEGIRVWIADQVRNDGLEAKSREDSWIPAFARMTD